MGSWRLQILACVGPAVSQPSQSKAPFSCEYDNRPQGAFVRWIDKRTGVFLLHCRVLADRTGVAFRMTSRSPPAANERRAGAIGGGWGVDLDDLVQTAARGRVWIRNGADDGRAARVVYGGRFAEIRELGPDGTQGVSRVTY